MIEMDELSYGRSPEEESRGEGFTLSRFSRHRPCSKELEYTEWMPFKMGEDTVWIHFKTVAFVEGRCLQQADQVSLTRPVVSDERKISYFCTPSPLPIP